MIDLTRSRTEWPLSLKLRRGLWSFVLQPLVRHLPKWCSPLRIWALRSMGASIGPTCLILPGMRVLMPWNLTLDGFVAIGKDVDIYNFAPVRIGRMTVISQYCFLCTGSHDYTRADMPLIFSPIDIGEQSWIAAGAFVAPGVRIAPGCVVGARSVVAKSLDSPWSVYAGNPCRLIKARTLAPESAVAAAH